MILKVDASVNGLTLVHHIYLIIGNHKGELYELLDLGFPNVHKTGQCLTVAPWNEVHMWVPMLEVHIIRIDLGRDC